MSSAVQILYRETEAAKVFLANLRDILGDDEQAKADTVEGETNLHDAIGIAVERIFALDEMIAGIDTKLTELKTRLSRFDAQRENIRTAICAAMEAGSLKKFEHALATVSLRSVPPKAEITDEALIPSKFWKAQDPKLDKKAVLDALKAKEAVPGAVMSNGSVTVSIKGS